MIKRTQQDHFHVNTNDSISTKLLRYVFSIYLVVSIIVTALHMVSEYRRVKKNIIEDINIIYLNSNPTMSIALWEADRDQMMSILDGMVKSPIILGVKISDPSGEYLLEKGETIAAEDELRTPETDASVLIRKNNSNLFGYQFPISNIQNERRYDLGNMTLYSSPSVVFSRVKSSYFFILINAVIKTTVLWVVFLWFSRSLLRRPLHHLTSAAQKIDMDNLEAIQIDVDSKGRNELTILADTLNDMVQKLLKARKELDKHREQLEVRVDERTAELTAANTRLKEEEEALRQAKQSADAANRSKSLFLANMSHELRTPLNIILGFSQLMLREEDASEQQRKNLKSIMQSGEHLLELINDVLEISKIEAGKVELYPESIDLFKLLENLEAMFQLRARQKGLTLEFLRADNVPQYIRIDRHKLTQILFNLLGNAIKFTERGGITLDVLLKQSQIGSQANMYQLTFSVTDTGVGIAANEQDKIFDTFFQAEAHQSSGVGTGLGLAISRKFVELMGGELIVESSAGQGSRFTFDVSIAITEQPDNGTGYAESRVVGLLPRQPEFRLLVAEDNPGNRDLLVTLLRSVGFEVKEAANGREAIDQWQQWQPHLMWVDLRMPEMDGLQAIREIRQRPGGQNTKIVALTAHAFEADKNTVMANGADDFLRKPFTESDIFRLLEKSLGVQFQYSEGANAANETVLPEPVDQDEVLSLLQSIPDDMRERFNKAIHLGELADIDKSIAEISEIAPDAGEFLKSLADEFAYDELAEYLKLGAGGK